MPATAIAQTPSRQQSPIRAASLRRVFAGYLLMRGRGRRHGQLLQKHTHPAHYHRINNNHRMHYHQAHNNPVIHASLIGSAVQKQQNRRGRFCCFDTA